MGAEHNTVDPDLVETPYNKNKLHMDIDSMKGIIEKGIKQGELVDDTPVNALANALVDIIYGEMLCWDSLAVHTALRNAQKNFAICFY